MLDGPALYLFLLALGVMPVVSAWWLIKRRRSMSEALLTGIEPTVSLEDLLQAVGLELRADEVRLVIGPAGAAVEVWQSSDDGGSGLGGWVSASGRFLSGVVAGPAILSCPLTATLHGVDGVLEATFDRGRRVGRRHRVVLAAAAARSASILRERHLATEITARERELEVLRAVSSRITAAENIHAVARAILDEIRRTVVYENARVYVVEPRGLVPIAYEGTIPEYSGIEFVPLRIGEGFSGWVAQHGEPLLLPNAPADPRGEVIPGTFDEDESMLVVPVKTGSRVVGVITLAKLGLSQFDGHDQRLLEILADHAASALESTRLVAQADRSAAELRELFDMSRAFVGKLDPDVVARTLLRHVTRVLPGRHATVERWVPTTGELVRVGATSRQARGRDARRPAPQLLVEVMVGRAARAITNDGRSLAPGAVATGPNVWGKVDLLLPMVSGDRPSGIAQVVGLTPPLDPRKVELAETMVNEAAAAIENARLVGELRDLADRDPLTTFYNHRSIQQRLSQELKRAERQGRNVAVLMMDLDYFKQINDSLGHPFGDRVLRWAAGAISASLRAYDIPGRYGGDEFVAILPDAGREAAATVASRIRARMCEDSSKTLGARVHVGISVGMSIFPDDGKAADELVAVADRRLYAAKASRRGTERIEQSGKLDLPGVRLVRGHPAST